MSRELLDIQTSDINNQTAQEAQEFNLFATLKPRLQKDGDQWCVLYGDNLQVGVAGFGDSPHLAIMNFNSQWYKEIESPSNVSELIDGTIEAINSLKM